MVGGYVGRVLRVNLSRKTFREEPLPDEGVLRKYVGGLGLGLRMLYAEVPPSVKPLDPENKLFFMTGPLTGTAVPSSTNYTVVTLSYDTEGLTLASSHSHGFWAARLKFAGFDGLIIEGVSEKPVYLWIENGKAELRDASNYWGKDTHDTEDLIAAEIGKPGISVACIGPAGENMVASGCIENDKHHTAAKGGTGSIMGSKKLKAIAVRGTGKVPLADAERLRTVARKWRKNLFLGNPSAAVCVRNAGILRNYFLPEASLLAAKNLTEPDLIAYAEDMRKAAERFEVKPKACLGCPIACHYEVRITDGPAKGYVATLAGGGENTEGAAAMAGIFEPGTVWMMTDIHDRLGLDSSTPGCTLGLVFECFEKGILTKKDTGGLELTWGNHEAAIKLLNMMVKREGFGNVIADGPRRAAERIGRGAEKLVVHVKGTGYNLHDWRAAWSTLLGQLVAGAGPVWQAPGFDSCQAEPDLGHPALCTDTTSTQGKADDVRVTQIKKIWDSDCLGLCWFGTWGVPEVTYLAPDALEAATGWKGFTREEGFAVGERVINLQRLFNMTRGLTIADDLDVGPRLLEAPLKGAAKGKSIAPYMRLMVEEYYERMGWERRTGKPSAQVFEKLGMKEYVGDLESLPSSSASSSTPGKHCFVP